MRSIFGLASLMVLKSRIQTSPGATSLPTKPFTFRVRYNSISCPPFRAAERERERESNGGEEISAIAVRKLAH